VETESDKSAQTALLVPIPAVDTVVSEHRRHLDPSARWGVPAHVTILFPFLAPSLVSDSVLARIELALSAVTVIDFGLERTAWFEDQVLWLAPEPADPFRHLIRTVLDAFPECPPYGGAVGEPVPHLTIGDRRGGASLSALQEAEVAVTSGLPLRTIADTMLLMTGRSEPASWHTLHSFRLRRSH
jgi:2'-5' RNA ligase